MPALRFKSTINCANCVRAVTPVLNELAGPGRWHVDTATPDKTLTVETAASPEALARAVADVGFELTPLPA